MFHRAVQVVRGLHSKKKVGGFLSNSRSFDVVEILFRFQVLVLFSVQFFFPLASSLGRILIRFLLPSRKFGERRKGCSNFRLRHEPWSFVAVRNEKRRRVESSEWRRPTDEATASEKEWRLFTISTDRRRLG